MNSLRLTRWSRTGILSALAAFVLAIGVGSATADTVVKTSRGSVKHSETHTKNSKAKVTHTPRGTTVTNTTKTTPRHGGGHHGGHHGGYHAGYRAGYRHGHYASRHDAWREWRRWRTVTGIIRLGVYYATRPRQSVDIYFSGATYVYSGGVFYQTSGSGYTVVSAPPGAVVYAVPSFTTVVYVGNTPYYYSNGTYYVATDAPADKPPPDDDTQTASNGGDAPPEPPEMTEDDHNYQVVSAPVGATVTYLPDDAEQKEVGGKNYYVYDGTYYQAFASGDETIYMVVEDPQA